MQYRQMSVRMTSEVVGTVDIILTEDLKLHKICAKDPLKRPDDSVLSTALTCS